MKKVKYKNLLLFIIIFWGIIFGCKLNVNATIVQPNVDPGINYDHHDSFILDFWGEYGFCFQRGYPFRSMVSDLQMTKTKPDEGLLMILRATGYKLNTLDKYGYVNTAEFLRAMTHFGGDTLGGSTDYQYPFFGGWGYWELNDDHTGLVLVSNDVVPSSGLVDVGPDGLPLFEKYTIDTEDGPVTQTTLEVLNPFQGSLVTGHEGAKAPYPVQLTQVEFNQMSIITGPNSKTTMDTSAVNAAAMVKYYIFEDPDTSSYLPIVKYKTAQALVWAIQYDLINTQGVGGAKLQMNFDSNHYGKFDGGTGYLSCDDFIKTYIGKQYEPMKLYRQFVWKMTNLRKTPSFGYEIAQQAKNNPIHLTWDANENAYVAIVADANGVLDYFDYSIPGVSITKNGDGTLKLKSSGQISGTLVSSPAQSKLLPDDCAFNLPTAWRWTLEGTQATFTYTAIIWDYEVGNNGGMTHDYTWGCSWYCRTDPKEVTSDCNGALNDGLTGVGWTRHEHDSSCGSAILGYPNCNGNLNTDWSYGHYTTHKHQPQCYHYYYCPSYNGSTTASVVDPSIGTKPGEALSPLPYLSEHVNCKPVYRCDKMHIRYAYGHPYHDITVKYEDWQDILSFYSDGGKTIVDPIHSYIAITTDPHDYPCETDVEILLIAENDEWNDLTYTMPNGKVVKHSSHVRVGEKFSLKYIYSYKGASKGFRVSYSETNKPYYNYTYLARMYVNNTTNIYDIRDGAGFFQSSRGVPNATLVQDLTDIKIRGIYTTPETAYTLNGMYKWDSDSQTQKWNDKVYLDALVNDQWDNNYNNKLASSITSSLTTPLLTSFTVSKPSHNDMLVVWEFDTEAEVFSSAMIYATAYIDVGANSNYSHSYFDAAYNYGKESMWDYYFSDQPHNNIGGVGYFSSGPSGESVVNHNVYTQNAELSTYAVRNKVWQSDIDIKVSNFVQNTGAGITEHIYQKREQNTHDMNYNLYYTIDVENPKATIFEHKIRMYANDTHSDMNTETFNTSADVYEFDVNNMISWGSTGASQTAASYGNTVVVDHIKTGRTYIQREIPTVLATITNGSEAKMNMKIYPNYDKLVYEEAVNFSVSMEEKSF